MKFSGKGFKKAIVIGNQNYQNIGCLKNCINDARDIKEILELKYFDVDIYYDLCFTDFLSIIQKFAVSNNVNSLKEVIFYYAGHAIQYLDKNYLLPVDFEFTFREKDIEVLDGQAIYLNEIANELQKINGIKLIILDSCRTFDDSESNLIFLNTIPFNKGLVAVESKEDMLIAYSTQPGNTARDGDYRNEHNGLYTGILKEYLKKYNQSILQMFIKTREEVILNSNYAQIPWESNSLICDHYLDYIKLPKNLLLDIYIPTIGLDTICFSSESLLVSSQRASEKGITKLWNLETPSDPIKLAINDFLEKIVVLNENIYFGISEKGSLYRFNVNNILKKNIINPTRLFEIEKKSFFGLALNLNYLAISDNEKRIYLFEILNEEGDIKLLNTCVMNTYIYNMCMDEQQIFIAGDKGLFCLNIKKFIVDKKIEFPNLHCLDMSIDGKKIYVGTNSNRILEIDVTEFKINRIIDIGDQKIHPFVNDFVYNMGKDCVSILQVTDYKEKQSKIDRFKNKSKKGEVLILKDSDEWIICGINEEGIFENIKIETNDELLAELEKHRREQDKGKIYKKILKKFGYPVTQEYFKKAITIKLYKNRFLIIGTNEPSIMFYDLCLKEIVNEIFLDYSFSGSYGESSIHSLDIKDDLLAARYRLGYVGIWELQT